MVCTDFCTWVQTSIVTVNNSDKTWRVVTSVVLILENQYNDWHI